MFVIDAFGARWTLDLSGLEDPLADELRSLWSRATVDPSAVAATDDAPLFVVARAADGSVDVGAGVTGKIHRGSDTDLPYTLSRALTLASIKRRAGQALMLHAAGVALPDGTTAALVGASGTGKTTASTVLCQTLGYVSDETVAVDPHGSVRAWPKPLSVAVDPGTRWEKHEKSPDELGLVRAPEQLQLGVVVILSRDPDLDGPPRLERIVAWVTEPVAATALWMLPIF